MALTYLFPWLQQSLAARKATCRRRSSWRPALERLETRTVPTVSILNSGGNGQKAFELGANFVLQKPISPTNAMRCFGAALSFMTRERRRYFRHPVESPILIIFAQGQELKATTTNISEGGMAIQILGKLPESSISKVVFTLPGASLATESEVDLAWADGSGRAGLRFVEMSQGSQENLEHWLAQHTKI